MPPRTNATVTVKSQRSALQSRQTTLFVTAYTYRSFIRVRKRVKSFDIGEIFPMVLQGQKLRGQGHEVSRCSGTRHAL